MANTKIDGNYKDTQTYKNADAKTRTKIERFKKENKIDNSQMFLLLLREDYRNLPKEEKQKGNRAAELVAVSAIISFLATTAMQRRDLLPYVAVYVFIASVLYFSGVLNPIARQLSNVNKLLKKYPKVPSLKEYLGEEKKEEKDDEQ